MHVNNVYRNTDTQSNTFKKMEYPLAQAMLVLGLNGRKNEMPLMEVSRVIQSSPTIKRKVRSQENSAKTGIGWKPPTLVENQNNF